MIATDVEGFDVLERSGSLLLFSISLIKSWKKLKGISAFFIFASWLFFTGNGLAQEVPNQVISYAKTEKTMIVEVWSDIMCPFCYIGKSRFEKALDAFAEKEKVKVIWRSFQLAPDLVTDPDLSIDEYLADKKGFQPEQAREMNQYVSRLAAEEGITFNLARAVVANSHKAHQLVHFARESGKDRAAIAKLFSAYFTEGENIDDLAFLQKLGEHLGLDTDALREALLQNTYAAHVQEDIQQAQKIGVRGVPFFVFNRSYAISGAQAQEAFSQTLEQAFGEWSGQNNKGTSAGPSSGAACEPDKNCN